MAKRQIWHIPKLHSNENEESNPRRVTWLELFYDLIFVVVISQTSLRLLGIITLDSITGFVLVFLPIWWVWLGSTMYNERFETEGIENRLIFFIKLIPLILLSAFSADATNSSGGLFALSFVLARGFMLLLWLRAGYHVAIFRPISNKYFVGFGLSILLFLFSIFITPPEKYYFWGIALFFDSITPFFTLKEQTKLPRMSSTKRPERFGLLIIIVLGEAFTGIVSGIKNSHLLNIWILISGFVGLLIGFSLWWIYFDFVGRRKPKNNIYSSISWGYLHLPLSISIVATGSSLNNFISSNGALSYGATVLFTSAIATFLIAIGLLELTLQRSNNEPTHKYLSSNLKIICGILGFLLIPFINLFSSLLLSLILFSLLLISMIYGFYTWFSNDVYDISEEI
ncbi:MAG: low temperature requirement protein A [Candidatus Kapabacteria bacterium]|nr:low temperature requirement protein A [Candidatus Kapabacteria bacterium]